MGFLSRLFRGRAAAPRQGFALASGGGYGLEVIGEGRYQDHLKRLCGGRTDEGAEHECTACLIPDPSNPDDPDAVRVEIEGQTVGYLRREDAVRYMADLERLGMSGRTATCGAVVIGSREIGTRGEGQFGVRLDLDWPIRRRTV